MTWNYPNEPELDGTVDLKYVLGKAMTALSQDEYGFAIAMLFGRDDLDEWEREQVKSLHRAREQFYHAMRVQEKTGIDTTVSQRTYDEMGEIAEELHGHLFWKLDQK